MQDKLMVQTAVFTVLFSIIAMSVMMGFAVGRERVCVTTNMGVTELKKEQIQLLQKVNFTEEKQELRIVKENNKGNHFTIPLPATITEEDMVIENSYGGHRLYITIAGIEKEYFEKYPLKTSSQYVKSASYQYHRGITRIELQLDKLYEHNAVVKNSNLYFDFANPTDIYKKIVVLDAGKNSTLSVCTKLKTKLEEENIKVYLTRSDNRTILEEEKVSLPNQLNADMFISFYTATAEDKNKFGVTAIYNKDYFIPTLGSIQLSDIMERNIVKECNTQALGLETSEKYAFLNKITIPATIIELGYISNEIEKEALEEEAYIDKIVEGAYKAIIEAYQLIE